MNISGMPTHFANAITPFSPLGKQAIGQENQDLKLSTLKPVEQLAELAKNQSKKNGSVDEKNKERVVGKDNLDKEFISADEENKKAVGSESEKVALKQEAEKKQLEKEQVQIQELSARDREVRNHERAHAAIGGQHAGAPSYTYQRGPDGISYAVGGEVSISTSKVSGNPQATIEKAQLIRRAALAPAEPSTQDRRVAATASQMEMEARQELVVLQQEQAAQTKENKLKQQSADESPTHSSVDKEEKSAVSFDVPRMKDAGFSHSDKFAGGILDITA